MNSHQRSKVTCMWKIIVECRSRWWSTGVDHVHREDPNAIATEMAAPGYSAFSRATDFRVHRDPLDHLDVKNWQWIDAQMDTRLPFQQGTMCHRKWNLFVMGTCKIWSAAGFCLRTDSFPHLCK